MMDLRDFANRNYKPHAIKDATSSLNTYISYDKMNNDMLFNGYCFIDGKPCVRYRLYDNDYIVYISKKDWDKISKYF